MDLSKVPNINDLKEISYSAKILYRKLLNKGIDAEIISIQSDNINSDPHFRNNLLSSIDSFEGSTKLERFLQRVVQRNLNYYLNDSNSKQKLVYITSGFTGCTSPRSCPSAIQLKEGTEIYVIALRRSPAIYSELEYMATSPVSSHAILMEQHEFRANTDLIANWISGDHIFIDQRYLLPEKTYKYHSQECLKCSRNAECKKHQNANTNDELGEYECVCSPGWSGDGFYCDDINECTEISNPCLFMQCCINTPGSYHCKYSLFKC
ncbi:hypothetical protein ACR3K2_33830 [Cryptosporidium serpentis]